MESDVLVTDAHWRKSLAAVRGLGKHGIPVTAGETTRIATAMFSKYCKKRVVYPSPTISPSAFLDYIRRLLAKNHYRMLLPMEEAPLMLFARHRDEISTETFLPVPAVETLEFAMDKDKVLRLAETIGIPVPKTWRITTLEQIEELKDTLPYPVVIKPRSGSGAQGISYPATPAQLTSQYHHTHRRYPFPLIQEKIPAAGPGYGASFLFGKGGDIKASFVHKRLREYPVTGGASTLRVSVRHDEILEMGRKLLTEMGWYGVAMVEFKIDPRDNTPKLMEVNPRFWGSLALSIAAGVNFPYLLYKMAKGERFKPVTTYKTGVKCRWFLPGDLLHFIHNPRRSRIRSDFFSFSAPDTTYDILSVSDPMPTLGRLLTPLTFLYDADMKRRLKMRKHGHS